MAQIAAERAEAAAPAVANPAPLGLSAFALTTFVLSSANAGWFTASGIVLGLALFYGGLVQLLAGMWEFRSGNTFGATAFCSYGGFWLALGFVLLPMFTSPSGKPGQSIVDLLGTGAGPALGFFLLGWTIFTFLMFLGTFRSTGALIAVFFFLFLTFAALTIGAFSGGSTWNTIGGWLGVITALVAWYTAVAAVLDSVKSPFRLPTFPRS